MTSGGAEIRLTRTDSGLWVCHFYRGGELPESLKGQFLTKTDAHRAIVRYLSSDNVLGKARWPKGV